MSFPRKIILPSALVYSTEQYNWKALLSELKISANTSTGIGYIIEYWSSDCERVRDFMQPCNAKSVSYSLSSKEKTVLKFPGSRIFPNKVLIAFFTVDLFVFIFVPSWLHNAAAFSKFDSSQYNWLRICLTFLLIVKTFFVYCWFNKCFGFKAYDNARGFTSSLY